MNLPSSWIEATPSASALANAATTRSAKATSVLARREDAVDDRDLVRVDAHLPLEAIGQRGAGRRFEPFRVLQIDPDRVERRLDAGGARRGDDLGAGKGQLGLVAVPRHVDVEREIAGAERDALDAGAGGEDRVEVRRGRAPSR